MGVGLYSGFHSLIFPLLLEGGKCLFVVSLASASYLFMRGTSSEAIKKLKMCTIGYSVLKCITIYIAFVDKIVNNFHF